MRRAEITEGPDSDGKYLFWIFWMDNYHPGHPKGEYRLAERGQLFKSNPLKYLKNTEWFDKRKTGDKVYQKQPDGNYMLVPTYGKK